MFVKSVGETKLINFYNFDIYLMAICNNTGIKVFLCHQTTCQQCATNGRSGNKSKRANIALVAYRKTCRIHETFSERRRKVKKVG